MSILGKLIHKQISHRSSLVDALAARASVAVMTCAGKGVSVHIEYPGPQSGVTEHSWLV